MKYYSFNEYCRDTFGCKVYKLSLDAGFTCPNRDGTLSRGGCIFCSGGSGRFAVSGKDIGAQLEAAKAFVKGKGAEKYIAYFQAYTNTYAPVETLRELFTSAIQPDDIVALDIATRPDCLPGEVFVTWDGSLERITVIPTFLLQTFDDLEPEVRKLEKMYHPSYIVAIRKKGLQFKSVRAVMHETDSQ